MIEETILFIFGFILCLAGIFLLLIMWMLFTGDNWRVKCPYCKNRQIDSSYKKQICNRCNKEWFEAYND